MEHHSVADYVVIGAGTAGCVLAARLSEDPGASVLVFEAGGHNRSILTRFSAAFFRINARYNWAYAAEPDASQDGHVERWAAGKVVGGSSVINAGGWTRGNPRDFDAWSAAGCEGWSYQDVLPFFRKSETFAGPESPFRGMRGPQKVSVTGVRHELTEAFILAAEGRGIRFLMDFNAAKQEGIGYAQVAQRRGVRSSAASAYLGSRSYRRNLRVVTGAYAERVLLNNGKAVGVEFSRSGQRRTVLALREVIVCAGGLSSPRVLLSSGIGPAKELEALGVPVNVDLPGVGRNLQDHVAADFTYGSKVPTLNTELNAKGVLKHGAEFILRGGGGATLGGSTAMAFVSLRERSPVPELEITFRPAAALVMRRKRAARRPGDDDAYAVRLLTTPAMQASVWLLHPDVRGRVTLRSRDPHDPPRISHQLLAERADVTTLVEGCHIVRDIFAQPPLRGCVTEELRPGSWRSTGTDLEAFLCSSARHAHHAAGTCAMGASKLSVVDSSLRVRGTTGLRVVDASVIPTLTSGHLNAPVVMIAEKAAVMVRDRRGT